jgi:hypothetical protein
MLGNYRGYFGGIWIYIYGLWNIMDDYGVLVLTVWGKS